VELRRRVPLQAIFTHMPEAAAPIARPRVIDSSDPTPSSLIVYGNNALVTSIQFQACEHTPVNAGGAERPVNSGAEWRVTCL
jgi:hypothetical protein